MEIRQLRYFRAVVSTGSFSEAALQSGRTQQAISKSISNLEKAVGVPILDRGGRTVKPTSIGKLLLQHAESIDRQIQSFNEQLNLIKQSAEGRVKVGVGPVAARNLLPQVARLLSESHPRLALEVFSGVIQDMIPELLTGELDILVGIETEEIRHPDIEKEILNYEKFCIVVNRDHPANSLSNFEVQELLQYPWIVGRNLGGLMPEITRAFLLEDINIPENVTYTTSLEFALGLLISSPAVTILPKGLIEEFLASGKLVTLAEQKYSWTRPLTMVFAQDIEKSPPVLSVMRHLNELAQLPD